MSARQRIDRLLVERGLAESREKAQAMLLAGEVLVNEQKITKAGQQVAPDAPIRVLAEPPKYVSRAGFKLEGAFDQFGITVEGQICLDIGASTGGFTDCLLQHGAAKVYAIDAGTAQLHWKIRSDPRVIVREKCNARYLDAETLPEPVTFFCCDVSFISVTLIMPALPPFLSEGAEAVVLAKPQFEVERGQVGKGGIVTDPALHAAVVDKVSGALAGLGFAEIRTAPSPVRGAEGNQEFLVYGRGFATTPGT